MIESGYHRPHTRFKMATQMGPGVSSAHEAMSHDGCSKYVSGFSVFFSFLEASPIRREFAWKPAFFCTLVPRESILIRDN